MCKSKEEQDREEEQKLSKSGSNKNGAYLFGALGQRLQKRIPLKQPYEGKLQAHII